MGELYGSAFVTAYGAKPSPLWLAAITEITDEQCRAGLTKLAKEPREYPANLTQFIAACTKAPPVRFLGGPSSMYKPLPLDHKPASPETRQLAIASIRRALGRPKDPA